MPGDHLDRAACLDLLGAAHLGRVSLSVDALPVIVPVGFALVGERLVLGTRADEPAIPATNGVVVAFQADSWDPDAASGWSVLVRGTARRLVDRADLGPLVGAGLPGWATVAAEAVVLATDVISGCRLVAADPGATRPLRSGVVGRTT